MFDDRGAGSEVVGLDSFALVDPQHELVLASFICRLPLLALARDIQFDHLRLHLWLRAAFLVVRRLGLRDLDIA